MNDNNQQPAAAGVKAAPKAADAPAAPKAADGKRTQLTASREAVLAARARRRAARKELKRRF